MDGMPALVPGQVLEELNEVVIQGSKELPQTELDPMVGQGIEKHSQGSKCNSGAGPEWNKN